MPAHARVAELERELAKRDAQINRLLGVAYPHLADIEAGRFVSVPADRVSSNQPGSPQQARAPPVPRFGFSIPEFCAAHGFSVAQYYVLKKQDLAPAEMKIGSRRIISIEAAAAWRAARTAATANNNTNEPA